MDRQGDPIFQKEISWETVSYHMNESEVQFLEALKEMTQSVHIFVQDRSLVQESLMNRAMSCLYSVEEALMEQIRGLKTRRNELVHGFGGFPQQRRNLDAEVEDAQRKLPTQLPEKAGVFDHLQYAKIEYRLDESLRRFDDLETDSKTDAAIELLKQWSGKNVCVLSQYEATVSYLHTVFSEEGSLKPILITGRMTSAEIDSHLSQYRSHGGLLLAIDAGLGGFDLREIDMVLHYDLPMSPRQLSFRIGRFNRIGRQEVLRMIGLVEENAVTGRLWEKMLSIAADMGLEDVN